MRQKSDSSKLPVRGAYGEWGVRGCGSFPGVFFHSLDRVRSLFDSFDGSFLERLNFSFRSLALWSFEPRFSYLVVQSS